MLIIESAGITDIGKKRKKNEDCLFLDDDQKLYVVADGMGGHRAGEVASRLVVETIQKHMKQSKEKEGASLLLSGIHLANETVYSASHNTYSFQGMGSTVSSVYFTGNTFIAANAGDSPIYLVRNKSIKLLSVIHNLFAEQMAVNPDASKYLSPVFKNMLTRAIGTEKTVIPDVCQMQYFKDDIIIICSDGLSNEVSMEEMLAVVNKQRPDKTCKTLVDLANKNGGNDNIIVIILRVKSPSSCFSSSHITI